MAMYTIQDSTLSNIADAIRNNLYTTNSSMTPLEMPSYIEQAIAYDEDSNDNFLLGTLYQTSDAPLLSLIVKNDATKIYPYKFYENVNIWKANFPNCSSIGNCAFAYCSSLTTANFPNCSYIGSWAFEYCSLLTSINFPNCSSIGVYAFSHCFSLTTVNFPNCSYIEYSAFYYCSNLRTANFPICSYIGGSAFTYCRNLISLYLMSTRRVALASTNAFYSTPISNYSTYAGQYGSIYVPASLLTSYQTAAGWSVYSSRFVGI